MYAIKRAAHKFLGGYTLEQLREAVNKSKTKNDPNPMMKYINDINKFYDDDRPKAITLIRNTFWTQKSNEYYFTPLFKRLTSKNLSTLIKTVDNKQVEKYIFEDKNNQILSHYPQKDLVELLSKHYSDVFAKFVFAKFRNFLTADERTQYLQIVSDDIMFMVYNHKNIGERMGVEDLLVCFGKIKTCMKSTQNDENDEKKAVSSQETYAEILPSITKRIIHRGIQSLQDNDLNFIFIKHIVTDDEIELMIKELIKRQLKIKKQLKSHIASIEKCRSNVLTSINKVYGKYDAETRKCDVYRLSSVKDAMKSLNNVSDEGSALRKRQNNINMIIQEMLQEQKQGMIRKCMMVQKEMNEQRNTFKETEIQQVKKISTLQKENERLRNERDQTQQSSRKQQTQINTLQKQKKKYTAENGKLTTKVQQLKQNVIDTKQRLDRESEKTRETYKQNEDLVAENKELKTKFKNAQGERNELKQKLNESKLKSDKEKQVLTNQYETMLKNQKKEMADLKKKLNKQSDTIKKQKNQMKKESGNLQQRLNDINNENIALTQANETLRSEKDLAHQTQQTQINTLQNENNQYKKNTEKIEHKLNESLKAKKRQEKNILELQNLLSDKSEQEEKDENAAKCLSKTLTDLNNEIESFKQNYNEKTLTDIFEKSPTELIQNDSETNENIKRYNKNTENVITSSKSFIKYINNIQSFIIKISIPKVSEYKTWNLQQIMAWIISLENGKYIKHAETLREGFEKSEIVTGDLLPELTRGDLSNPPFSINQFLIRRDLENHFKSLASSNIIPYVNNNIPPSNNDNEGTHTQYEYIDR